MMFSCIYLTESVVILKSEVSAQSDNDDDEDDSYATSSANRSASTSAFTGNSYRYYLSP